MTITKVEVIDPRSQLTPEDPYLAVFVDNHPKQGRVSEHGEYRVTRLGPFFQVEHLNDNTWAPADYAMMNAAGVFQDQLVSVEVHSGVVHSEYAMQLPRARRELRKHTAEWRYVVDEMAAENAAIYWRLQRADPICFVCKEPAVRWQIQTNTYIELCEKHAAKSHRPTRMISTRLLT